MFRFLKRIASRLGFLVIRRSVVDAIVEEHPWLADRLGGAPVTAARTRPPLAAKPRHNPRLDALRQRYRGHPATAHTVWAAENVTRELDIEHFRADNVYVWQTRVNSPVQYLLSTYYARENDPLGLFGRMREDGAFGAMTVDHGGRAVSRDMLDSILEISFLEEQIGVSRIPGLTVLDIGAGYGRLAHRMTETLPNLERYLCADAVPESTVVSELYVRHRDIAAKVTVVPLDEAATTIPRTRIDVAVNIHSFSECALTSIEFWLDLIEKAGVPWIFIVPNTDDQLVTTEADHSRRDFLPSLRARGYEIAVQRPKYHRSPDVQKFGLFPATYFLFKKVSAPRGRG